MAYFSASLRRLLINDMIPLKNQSGLLRFYSKAEKGAQEIRPSFGAEIGSMFSARRMKKNWELLPLFIIMGGAVLGLSGYIVYATQTRDDVRFFSKANFETADPLNPKKRKLLVFGQDYRPMTEVAEAYEGMDEQKQEKAENGSE